MDKKTFTIGVLSITALILFVANLVVPQNVAHGDLVIKDRDFQAITARTTKGGDALYLTDNRTGIMAVLGYNPQKRHLDILDVKEISSAFDAGNGGAGVGVVKPK